MQKKSGFSLVEMMVSVAIIGILFGITVPRFERTQSINKFRDEVQSIFDMIADARASALAGQRCGANETVSWIFEISPANFALKCNFLNMGALEEMEIRNEEIAWGSHGEIEFFQPDGTADGVATMAFFFFQSETAQAKIMDNAVPANQKQIARIVFAHPGSGNEETLCMNRIAGFPEKHSGNIPCVE